MIKQTLEHIKKSYREYYNVRLWGTLFNMKVVFLKQNGMIHHEAGLSIYRKNMDVYSHTSDIVIYRLPIHEKFINT